MFDLKNTKYHVKYTSRFKREFKKSIKQGKDEQKFLEVLSFLANGYELSEKYRNHKLLSNRVFKNCNECHIMPDWLLIYEIRDDELILLLCAIGSHSDLFK